MHSVVLHMKRGSPDFTNLMTAKRTFERRVCFPLLEEEPARGSSSRYAHQPLSVRGRRALGRLLLLLPTHLGSKLTSRVSPFPPFFLFSVCSALRRDNADHADGSVEEDEDDAVTTSVLPSVLSKLRAWRLLDPDYRCSSQGVHELALDLVGIVEDASASTSASSAGCDRNSASYCGRLRMKWIRSDHSSGEIQDQEASPLLSTFPSLSSSPSPSPTPTPSPLTPRSGVFDSAYAHVHLHYNTRQASQPCQSYSHRKRIDTPDSEDASAGIPACPAVACPPPRQRRHSASEFRSGCASCRHPRISTLASAPPSPLETSFPSEQLQQRTPFGDVNQLDTIFSPRRPKSSVVRHAAVVKKTRRANHHHHHSIDIPRPHGGLSVDENKPLQVLTKPSVHARDRGVSFPCLRLNTSTLATTRQSKLSLPRHPIVSPGAVVISDFGTGEHGKRRQRLEEGKAVKPSERGRGLSDHIPCKRSTEHNPSHLHRPRSHGIVASIDLRLPLGKGKGKDKPSRCSSTSGDGGASPNDLLRIRNSHVGVPIRAQSFSCDLTLPVGPGHGLPVGFGSVSNVASASASKDASGAGRVPQLSLGLVGFGFGSRSGPGSGSSSKGLPLPSWSGSRHPTTITRTTTSSLRATTPPSPAPLSRIPAKASVENALGFMTAAHSPRTPRTRPSSSLVSTSRPSRGVASHLGLGRRPPPPGGANEDPTRRSVSSPIHRQTRSVDLTLRR